MLSPTKLYSLHPHPRNFRAGPQPRWEGEAPSEPWAWGKLGNGGESLADGQWAALALFGAPNASGDARRGFFGFVRQKRARAAGDLGKASA